VTERLLAKLEKFEDVVPVRDVAFAEYRSPAKMSAGCGIGVERYGLSKLVDQLVALFVEDIADDEVGPVLCGLISRSLSL